MEIIGNRVVVLASPLVIDIKGHLWKPHYPKRSFRERERCGM